MSKKPKSLESTPSRDNGNGAGAAFPVVGIGASAGGLEALRALLRALPHQTGMAFVIVQHLAPEHASSLAEILSRATKMPVCEVRDEPAVKPNHVYVIPPGRDMLISGGRLLLLPQERNALHRGIDQFFRSLAEDSRHQAIAVVLSGSATDGTLGLEVIKAEGGVTFAQDESAQHGSMPKSAVASGCVDFVLPPEGIALEIARIARHPYIARAEEDEENNGDVPGHGRIAETYGGGTGRVRFTGIGGIGSIDIANLEFYLAACSNRCSRSIPRPVQLWVPPRLPGQRTVTRSTAVRSPKPTVTTNSLWLR